LVLSTRPLQRPQSLHEQTYLAIRTAILSGELAAGERLIETQLADQLQVSRTPIREAIRQLQQENLVTGDGHGSLRVATLNVADAVQLYDCRIALEQLSVSEACRNITTNQLEQLEEIVQQSEQAIKQQPATLTHHQLLQMDYQFHRLLAESSGNTWLVQILDQVFDKMAILRLRTLQHNPGVLEIGGEHCRIYDAVRDRNSIAANQAILFHLISSKERVIREIKQLEGEGG